MSAVTASSEAWSTTRLGWLFQPVSGRGHEDATVLSVYRDHGVIPKESRTDNFNRTPEDLSNYQLVQPGDLVVNRMKAWQGSLAISEHQGIVSPDYEVLRPAGPENDGRFLHSLLRSRPLIEQYALRSTGIRPSQWRLYWGEMKSIETTLPPAEEQRAIAAYLDRETARIGTLIEEQQRLIEMLDERRRSVVDRAIAGLDGDGRRPTNDPWWPELPDGWALLTLRRVIRALADGPHFSPNYVADGVMFLSARNVKIGRWSLDDAKFVSEDDYREFSKRVVPELGDVLYTKGGTTGIARAVDLDIRFQVWVHVAVLKVRHDIIDPFFLAHALNSTPCYDQSQLLTRGATNNDLGLTRMVNIVLPVPLIEKQRQTVAYLDHETQKIDALIAEAERFIELSRERRSALITAAVTGQIDIREMA